MLIYDKLMVGQFLVETQIRTMAKDTNGRPIFFGKDCRGRSVLVHFDFHRPPFAPSFAPFEVLARDFRSDPENMELDTVVHAVCENGPRGPRAVRWCRLANFLTCVHECNQRQEAARREEAAAEEGRRQSQAEAERRRTENPSTIEVAIAHGWQIVDGGNGRQRILERPFPDEAKPRRITRHLPPGSLTKSPAQLRLVRV